MLLVIECLAFHLSVTLNDSSTSDQNMSEHIGQHYLKRCSNVTNMFINHKLLFSFLVETVLKCMKLSNHFIFYASVIWWTFPLNRACYKRNGHIPLPSSEDCLCLIPEYGDISKSEYTSAPSHNTIYTCPGSSTNLQR